MKDVFFNVQCEVREEGIFCFVPREKGVREWTEHKA